MNIPNATEAFLVAGIVAGVAAGAPIVAGVCAFLFWIGRAAA